MISRTVEFVYKVLRNGADYAFLREIGTPVVRCIDSGDIKMSFSGTFDPQARNADGDPVEIDWFKDEIEPILKINGEEHALGVFLPATVKPSEQEGVKRVNVEAFDRCWKIRDNYTDSILHIAAGTSYITAIESLLTSAGITTVLAVQSTATMSEDREDWPVGTSYLEIINTLLSEINYNPLWFNSFGVAMLEPASVPTVENIEHTLTANDVESMLAPHITQETDIYKAPNVFLCICDNADKNSTMTAKAENTNPQSPLSISRRGRRIVQVTYVDNIASQNELQAFANRQRDESMIRGEKFIVDTALLPGFGVADVTALHYGDINAICVEREWSMALAVGGTMRHTLEKVVYSFV